MAYALRYYKEIAQADGGVVRLEIHKKDSTTAAVEIGAVVQGLSLEIQGQQDDIDTPIQKTSLHMTFVDASDIENGQKNGFWQEFYTPDALMWKVILKAKDATETSFRTIWGGYVTPDSFSEDLVYRGSVSITARDNIGHMQDFPFDAEGDADGMISLYNLVESGWEKIQSPMMLEWRGAADSTMWLMCDGVSAMFTLMNVSMFEGMDWYKAIETALASYGVVMRYVGNNIVKMSSLRSMPYQGEEFIEDLTHIEPTFVSGATRELIPAVKRIEERVEYDVTDSVTAPQLKSDDFTGESSSVVLSTSTGSQFTLEGWSIKNTERGEGWMNNVGNPPSYFFPEAYDLSLLADADSRDDEFMWFAFSQYATGDNRYAVYSRRMMPCAMTMRLAFGSPYRLVNRVLTPVGNARADYAMIAIEVVADGVSYFLQKNGGWGNNLDLLTYNNEQVSNGELVIDIPTDGFDQSIILNVRIYEAGYYSWAQDTYIPLYSLDFSANNVVMEKNSVNTNYNAENNVILSRDPEIGPAYDRVALPAFIKNGIFYRSGDAILPAKKWSWGSGSEQQMAVWNHLQLLSYYAKPNNLISGTIVNADITRATAIYVWHGAEHILVSGRYNFLNGHIESAVLREFARYEDMWSEVAGADMPDTEQDSRSNVEDGASSSGASSTYSNTTTVNIGSGGGGGTGASNLNDLLDVDTTGVVAQSVLYYNGTSWVDMSLNTLLNPYLKADVAAKTYALKSVYEAFVASLGSLAYKNGLTASDVGALSTSGGTIEGTSVAPLLINTSASDSSIVFRKNNVSKTQIGYSPSIGSFIYNYASGASLGIKDDGTPHFNGNTLYHTGNFNPANYLPKAGGTIDSGSNDVPLVLKSSGTTTWLRFTSSDGAARYIGVGNGNTLKYQFGGLSYNILTSAGGTIKNGSKVNPFNIDTDATDTLYISLKSKGEAKAYFVWNAGWGIYLQDSATNRLGLRPEGTPFYRTNDVNYSLIHSGNVGEYAFTTAAKMLTSSDTLDAHLTGIYGYKDGNNPTNSFGQNAAVLSLKGIKSAPVFQLAFDGNTTSVGYRNQNYAGTWTAWKTIAFTDSNVASAQALMHSNGTVGATVASSGRIDFSGNIALALDKSILDPSGRSIFMLDGNNSPQIGFDTVGSYSTYINGKDVYLRYGSSRTAGLILNSSGNLTIGASDLAGTSYKLLVAGDIGLYNYTNLRAVFPDNTNINIAGVNSSKQLVINSIGSTIPTIIHGGNVGIGTTNPQYKLDVNGSVAAFESFNFTREGWNYITTPATSGNIAFNIGVAGTANTKMCVLNNGHVLIDKTTDDGSGARLQVNGAINTTDNYKIGGLDVLRVRTDHLAIGEETAYYSSLPTKIYGKEVVIGTGTSRIDRLIVSDSGATIKGNLVVQGDISA